MTTDARVIFQKMNQGEYDFIIYTLCFTFVLFKVMFMWVCIRHTRCSTYCPLENFNYTRMAKYQNEEWSGVCWNFFIDNKGGSIDSFSLCIDLPLDLSFFLDIRKSEGYVAWIKVGWRWVSSQTKLDNVHIYIALHTIAIVCMFLAGKVETLLILWKTMLSLFLMRLVIKRILRQ